MKKSKKVSEKNEDEKYVDIIATELSKCMNAIQKKFKRKEVDIHWIDYIVLSIVSGHMKAITNADFVKSNLKLIFTQLDKK